MPRFAERWRLAIAVAVVTAAVWGAGIVGPYHFDDAITPQGDPASQSVSAWLAHVPDTLRPLTKLTYATEASLGLDEVPAARRAVTVAIHAAAAVLLMLLLGGGPRGAALALLWACHPVHAEAVLAIAGRSSALSNALVLGALLAHQRDRLRLAAVLLGAAALARETAFAAVLPLAVLELASDRPWRDHVRRLVPAAMAVVLAAVWIVATPRVRDLAGFSFHDRPLAASAARQLAAVPVGISLYVRVWALSIDHGEALPSVLASPLPLLALALYAAALAWVIRRRSLGAALWLAAVLPTQSIVPKLDPLTERPLALALAGVVIAGSFLVRRARWVIPLVAALALATVLRGRQYRSDLAIWADAAAKSATNPRPYLNYGYYLHHAGRDAEALEQLERAHAIAPDDLHITELRDALLRRP